MIKKWLSILLIVLNLFLNSYIVIGQETKFPDYSYEYLGEDKFEGINRKIFNFNLKLNKYAIRPIHILWSSIMPQYGMDRLQGITNNIEYPIRLISSLIQRDFTTSKNETIRFFTNSILGLGGMFDPARHLFNIKQSKENMEQALEKCKIKRGSYFVCPVLSFTSIRGLFGKALDMALNPSCYIGSPVLALAKAGLTINKTSYMQPFIKMIESTYADPYEIAKKAYGIDLYIKNSNLDRLDVISKLKVAQDTTQKDSAQNSELDVKKTTPEKKQENIVTKEVSSELILPDLLYGGTNIDKTIDKSLTTENFKLVPDIILKNYNPQNPVVDSMRTALFNLPEANKSLWNELSIWNRSFAKTIKQASVQITEGQQNYNYRYLINRKNKNAPLAVIYPSIGEGINSSHSIILAKIFHDAGYSVVIQGSHFQWEFIKSMPKNYRPGLPNNDSKALITVTGKIIEQLKTKYNCEFPKTVIIGTSFGALTSLFVGANQYKNNTLGKIEIISICPPVDLIYAMKQVDKISQEWNKAPENLKEKVANAAAKVVNLYEEKSNIDAEVNNLPFSEEEGKLITAFIMHQKLSDIIYTIENTPEKSKNDLYFQINNMNFEDYTNKYLLSKDDESCDDLTYEASLYSISNYLQNADNYKIYHSVNDYLTNQNQLKTLKQYANKRLVFLDNGAHLGFLYRKEFLDDLIEYIAKK